MLDMSNLASEMVSDREPRVSLRRLYQKVNEKAAIGGVGRIFVKFGEDIDLKKYLSQKKLAPLKAENFSPTAFMITEDLIRQ